MARRVTEGEKKEILKSFNEGKSIKEISLNFKFTETTIIRQLKTLIKTDEYKKLNSKVLFKNEKHKKVVKKKEIVSNKSNFQEQKSSPPLFTDSSDNFYEIKPLEDEYQFEEQKDLSSVQLSEIEFPKVLFMIVNKTIELETKKLKDYPDWQFLSKNDLDRNTIEIFDDLKIAKRFCKNDQKVIKVPNTNVFKIVAPLLLSKGISRIVRDKTLIAL